MVRIRSLMIDIQKPVTIRRGDKAFVILTNCSGSALAEKGQMSGKSEPRLSLQATYFDDMSDFFVETRP